jgi:competence protein ComEA
MKNEQKITNAAFFNGWSLTVCLLAIIIIAGGIAIFVKSSQNPGIEISITPEKTIEGQIYIGGEVNNPGFYPLFDGDNFEDIIRAAGGVKDGADLSKIELAVAPAEEGQSAQKININRAESWLLEALPGIGESKAGAIIAYRQQNGLFQDINELLKVPGLGEVNFNQVKDLITVHD